MESRGPRVFFVAQLWSKLRIVRAYYRLLESGRIQKNASFERSLVIYPGSPSRLFFEWFFRKDDIVLVGIYNQQFKGTILFMVLDFQGIIYYSFCW